MFFAYVQMYFSMSLSLRVYLKYFSWERAIELCNKMWVGKTHWFGIYKAESDDSFSQICHFRLSCFYYFQHLFRIREREREIDLVGGFLFFFPFIFISWRLTTLQYCSVFCHTLTWISHGVTCTPHPDPLSHLPLHPTPLGLPSAPGLSTCLMHPAWAGDLFHPR